MMTRPGQRLHRLIFFGDSICVGQGVSIHKGWVPRIALSMESLAEQLGLKLVVVNASMNGGTTRQALERMMAQAEQLGANAVLNVRFTTSAITQGAAELYAYGTAVIAEPEE